MLQNSLIYNPAGSDTPLGRSSSGRWEARLRVPRMVVSRDLCTYVRVPCEGVPFYRLREFARLQAQLHSPFVQFGSSAVKSGNQVHIWIWDAVHEQRFAHKHGNPRNFLTLAQSLLCKPVQQGVLWLAGGNAPGREAQLWSNKQLQDSLWFDEPPTQQTWAQRHIQFPELAEIGWPRTLPAPQAPALGNRSWAVNLTPRSHKAIEIPWFKISNGALVLAAAGVAIWGAWLQGQMRGYSEQIEENQQYQDQKVTQEAPQQQGRAEALATVQRIKQIQALNANTQVLGVLDEVAKLFSRQGLWVRDIEINGTTVEATLTAPPGVTPRLTAILGVIENSDRFYDARFVDVSSGAGFKFSWRIKALPGSTLPEAAP